MDLAIRTKDAIEGFTGRTLEGGDDGQVNAL